jgi:hypothetical protein
MPRHSVYHSLLAAFQIEVIKRALAATGGNRTHAARLLGLQRTYLLRLMRDRGIDVPRPQRKGGSGNVAPASPAAPPGFRIEITGWEPRAPSNGGDQPPEPAVEARPPETERFAVAGGSGQAAARNR